MAATAKTIVLKGNPNNPESAEHHVIFPGGSISVCRTSDNQYWAHIEVYTPTKGPKYEGERERKHGKIEMIRIDTIDGVKEIKVREGSDHFAILISTE